MSTSHPRLLSDVLAVSLVRSSLPASLRTSPMNSTVRLRLSRMLSRSLCISWSGVCGDVWLYCTGRRGVALGVILPIEIVVLKLIRSEKFKMSLKACHATCSNGWNLIDPLKYLIVKSNMNSRKIFIMHWISGNNVYLITLFHYMVEIKFEW